jgi:hypothetical protein
MGIRDGRRRTVRVELTGGPLALHVAATDGNIANREDIRATPNRYRIVVLGLMELVEKLLHVYLPSPHRVRPHLQYLEPST